MKTKHSTWKRCTAWLLCAALCLTLTAGAAPAAAAGGQATCEVAVNGPGVSQVELSFDEVGYYTISGGPESSVPFTLTCTATFSAGPDAGGTTTVPVTVTSSNAAFVTVERMTLKSTFSEDGSTVCQLEIACTALRGDTLNACDLRLSCDGFQNTASIDVIVNIRSSEPADTQTLTVYEALEAGPGETVYQLDGTVTAAYDSEYVYVSGLEVEPFTRPNGFETTHGVVYTIPVKPADGDSGLTGARRGDGVSVEGRITDGPDGPVFTAAYPADVTPSTSPLRGLADGGTYTWTDGNDLKIPWWMAELTVQGDGGEMPRARLTAASDHPGLKLTAADLNIETIKLEDFSMLGELVIRGTCTLHNGIIAVWAGTLTLEPGASLVASGEVWSSTTHVASSASLTCAKGLVTLALLQNDGLVRALGLTTDGSIVEGTGATVCENLRLWGNTALNGPGPLIVTKGVESIDGESPLLTLGPDAVGLIAGGVQGDVTVTDHSNGGMLVMDGTPTDGDAAAPLDLSAAAETVYLYTDTDEHGTPLGAAAWTPAAGDAPGRLVLNAFYRTGNNGLLLGKGVILPENTAVDVTMSANSAIENGTGPAVSAPGCALSFHTAYRGADWRPGLHADTPHVAVSAPGGSVAFTGGDFRIYGGAGAADVPVRLERGLGAAEFSSEETAAVPRGVTVDPTGAGEAHAEIRRYDGAALAAPSNRAISYSGDENVVIAAIEPGKLDEPAPTGGGGGVSTYAVTYRANYENGPADVRDAGYGQGSAVTVKGADLFAAPEGMVFSGWAQEADGPVTYAPGDTFKMPAKPVTLYAVWAAGPALNRAEHLAYLEGYPDGRIGPEDLLTREQTAAIFYRLLTPDSRARYQGAASPFPDVADGRWSAGAIAAMASAGLLKGQPDGSFAPERPVTRAEFAAIAARFDSEAYSGPDLFKDISGHWAAAEINRAGQRGWVRGTPDGLYEPDRPITRAEAAALINRVLERAPETADDLLPGMRTFPDNLDPAAWFYLDLQEAANGHDFERRDGGVYERWTALHT